jgi:hypothetical protein
MKSSRIFFAEIYEPIASQKLSILSHSSGTILKLLLNNREAAGKRV